MTTCMLPSVPRAKMAYVVWETTFDLKKCEMGTEYHFSGYTESRKLNARIFGGPSPRHCGWPFGFILPV